MADNKFSMLVDDENEKNVVPETKEEIDKNTTTIDVKSSDVDDVNWTVQQTKNRRLAPSFSLSRHDLGADSPRAKIAQSPATTLAFSPPPGSNAFLTTPMSPTSALKKKGNPEFNFMSKEEQYTLIHMHIVNNCFTCILNFNSCEIFQRRIVSTQKANKNHACYEGIC